MAANVGQFTAAIDKVYKSFSTQVVNIDQKELRGLNERGAKQVVEKKFQEQLLRARAALLQEFRNHSVVAENEVKKIREELTEKLEDKYGEQIAQLRQQTAEGAALVQKHVDEIAHLKKLASAQETYLAAVRHRWGLETKERLRGEIDSLKEDLEDAKKEIADLSHQLLCRDDLVAQLGSELSGLEAELKKQAGTFAEEKRAYEERLRNLRLEMRQQQDSFNQTLRDYEQTFSDYRQKTASALQVQEILNTRRTEALECMEEERQRHIKARTKPSPRIGPYGEVEEDPVLQKCLQYDVSKDTRYRVDDMGMDTSWRDYRLADSYPLPQGQKKRAVPKFRAERLKKGPTFGPHAPVPTDVGDELQ